MCQVLTFWCLYTGHCEWSKLVDPANRFVITVIESLQARYRINFPQDKGHGMSHGLVWSALHTHQVFTATVAESCYCVRSYPLMNKSYDPLWWFASIALRVIDSQLFYHYQPHKEYCWHKPQEITTVFRQCCSENRSCVLCTWMLGICVSHLIVVLVLIHRLYIDKMLIGL